MWEDPIVAEVRRVRQEIFARFNYDVDVYFEHLKTVEEEDRQRGARYTEGTTCEENPPQPDAV